MENEYSSILKRFDAENRHRVIPADRTGCGSYDLASNDYLGLGARWKEFVPEFLSRFPDASFSSSASRLLSQRQNEHLALENLLASLYGKDVLLFNSGYHANVGITQALAIPGTVFLSDKLIHASMIDGLSLAGAEFRRWRHNDTVSLRKLLDKYSSAQHCVVMLESVYSMDGDVAPLAEIVEMKKEFPNMVIYLDEAHAFGTFGHQGLGLAEHLGLIGQIDILVGTLGKAAASSGAFVATSPLLKDFFINCSRSFIFSTALPPANAAWSLLMVEKIIGMDTEREHLHRISESFNKGLQAITGNKSISASHISPLMIGDAAEALRISSILSAKGIDALAIRRPTVPEGTERIRFSLSAALTESDVNEILRIIEDTLSTQPVRK